MVGARPQPVFCLPGAIAPPPIDSRAYVLPKLPDYVEKGRGGQTLDPHPTARANPTSYCLPPTPAAQTANAKAPGVRVLYECKPFSSLARVKPWGQPMAPLPTHSSLVKPTPRVGTVGAPPSFSLYWPQGYKEPPARVIPSRREDTPLFQL